MSRLLIVQDRLRHGGTESHTVWLAGALRAQGVDTSILTFRPGGELEARAAKAGVPVASLQPFDMRIDSFAPGFAARLRALAPDAVLLMGRVANARAAAVRRALPGARLVGSWRSGRPMPGAVRRALPLCDVVVGNARCIAATVPVEPAKRVVIPNPPVLPPLAATPESRAKARAEAGAADGDILLLCVAAFRPGKGQDELIRTFARVRSSANLRLWLAGDGEKRAACEALARAEGVADRVRFLGHSADPRPLYLAADLAVMASAAEALPNFLVEAQLHGVPVAAWAAGGVEETFLPGESGLLTPHGDRDALASAWDALAVDPERRARFADKARSWAPGVFTETAATDAYRKLFFPD